MLPTLRAARLGDRRFLDTGLTIAEADALVPHLGEFAAPARAPAEVEAMLAERIGAEPRGCGGRCGTTPRSVHAPTGGPWSFGPGRRT